MVKKGILDSEILPESYKIFREDIAQLTHPIDSSNPKKNREGGGGIIIAHQTDIDVENQSKP